MSRRVYWCDLYSILYLQDNAVLQHGNTTMVATEKRFRVCSTYLQWRVLIQLIFSLKLPTSPYICYRCFFTCRCAPTSYAPSSQSNGFMGQVVRVLHTRRTQALLSSKSRSRLSRSLPFTRTTTVQTLKVQSSVDCTKRTSHQETIMKVSHARTLSLLLFPPRCNSTKPRKSTKETASLEDIYISNTAPAICLRDFWKQDCKCAGLFRPLNL